MKELHCILKWGIQTSQVLQYSINHEMAYCKAGVVPVVQDILPVHMYNAEPLTQSHSLRKTSFLTLSFLVVNFINCQ